MAIKIAHASINENGQALGGKPGDQTKKEVCIREWYLRSGKEWNVMLRATDPKIAKKIADTAEKGAKNDAIGYSQNVGRLSFYSEACKVDHKVEKIKTDCNTDCSAFTSECVIAAGVKVSPAGTTRSLRKDLVETGKFKEYTDSKYLTMDKYLKRGDILLCEGRHVVIVIEDGTGDAVKNTSSKYTKRQFIADVKKILNVKTVSEALDAVPTISRTKNKKHALVTPLERYLKSIDMYHGSIEADNGKTPTFGAGMAEAVIRYQKEKLNYKTQDGEITKGGKMWSSLLS